jgi:predicted nucleic acid-binding Zn ribbon protein
VLAQWRGIDMAPLEVAWADGGHPAAEVVGRVVKQLGLDRRQSGAEVLRTWSQLLDPNIAAHAQPTGLRNGTLFVTVDSSVWLDEIVRYRQKEILLRLRTTFGPELVKRISFRVG